VRVRHELEARVQTALTPSEAGLRDQLVDIVQSVQRQLFNTYTRSRRQQQQQQQTAESESEDAHGGVLGSPEEMASVTDPTSSADSVPPEAGPGEFEELAGPHILHQPEESWFGGELGGFDGLLFNFPPAAHHPALAWDDVGFETVPKGAVPEAGFHGMPPPGMAQYR
jgi:hypothetical protein